VSDLDNRVRLHVYEGFVARGRPPTPEEAGTALGIPADEAVASYRRLEEGRVVALAPGTANIWMANPFSAVPTPFRVLADDGRSWWGNCAWDGLGILAAVQSDGSVDASCADCGERIEFRVENGELQPIEVVIHFAVPARRWWDNIGFA
jgi:hypothetical protein